jgi:hypothetical protein
MTGKPECDGWHVDDYTNRETCGSQAVGLMPSAWIYVTYFILILKKDNSILHGHSELLPSMTVHSRGKL